MAYDSNIDSITIWHEYEYLEADFVKCVRYLPFIPENYNVWSPHFSDLIIRIGSVFDSFLKKALFCESLNSINDIETIRSKKPRYINMADYHTVFNDLHHLFSKKIFNLYTFEPFIPFSEWKEINTTLEWWEAYRKLKHNRFENKEVATLKATFNALGALFLVIILHPETAEILVDFDIIHGNYDKKCIKNIISGKERQCDMVPIYAKTNLFGFVFDSEAYTLDDEYKKHMLSPSYPGY